MWNECKDLQEYIVGVKRSASDPGVRIASAGNSCFM